MYTLGQVFYAIGFLYNNDLGNIHYTPLTPSNEKQFDYKETKLYRLEVVELVIGKNEYSGEPGEGLKLKDQYGDIWVFNYPTIDSSGRGMVFSYCVESIEQEEFSKLVKSKPLEIREASGFFQLLNMYAKDARIESDYRKWLQAHLENVLTDIKEKFNLNHLIESTFKNEEHIVVDKDNRFVRYVFSEKENKNEKIAS